MNDNIDVAVSDIRQMLYHFLWFFQRRTLLLCIDLQAFLVQRRALCQVGHINLNILIFQRAMYQEQLFQKVPHL